MLPLCSEVRVKRSSHITQNEKINKKKNCMVWSMKKMPKVQTRQWRRSCSSCSYHWWQSRNRRRRIDNHRSAATRRARRSLPQARRPYRRSPAWIPHRSWTLCTCEPSSISSPWMSFCTRRSPTFRSSPALRQHRISWDMETVKAILENKIKIHTTYHLESHSHCCWCFWWKERGGLNSEYGAWSYIKMWVFEMPLELTVITILVRWSIVDQW